MNLINRIIEYLGIDTQKTPPTDLSGRCVVSPMGGLGAIDVSTSYKRAGAKHISPTFAIEYIDVMRYLATYNPDVKKAVNNLIFLGSTDYYIELPDNIRPRNREKIMSIWHTFEAKVLGEFIRNGIQAISITGALCTEVIIEGNPYPSSVKAIDILNSKYIRFEWSDLRQEFEPHQISFGTPIYFKKETFTYSPIVSHEGNPYGIPPFLAAIEAIESKSEALGSLKTVLKKIGVLGFLEVLTKAPGRNSDEPNTPAGDKKYQDRILSMLQSFEEPIKKGLNNGIILGVEGMHTFNFHANTLNTNGAKDFLDIFNKMLYNGLSTDGTFMNDNQNTTETFARVILQVMLGQIRAYHKMLSKSIEKAFMLECRLNNVAIDYVKVVFKAPVVGDEVKIETAYNIKIDGLIKLLNSGIISPAQMASELGYDKPYNASSKAVKTPATNPTTDNGATDPSNTGTASLSKGSKFEFFTDFKDAYLNRKSRQYIKDVEALYAGAVKLVSDSLKEFVSENNFGGAEDFAVQCSNFITKNFEGYFLPSIENVVIDVVSESYEHFRNDKSIFETENLSLSNKNLKLSFPDAILDFWDERLIEFMTRSDLFYLGKFITDEPSIAAFMSVLRDFYVANDGEIGNSSTLNDFYSVINSQLLLEKYKIRRIIDTTMNNVRAYASIRYMNQAGVSQFKRIEVGDNRTCAHCTVINGKIFEVSNEITKLEQIMASSPADISVFSPFATKIDLTTFKSMTAQEMQLSGIGMQSMHPHCRGRLVAVIEL